MKRHHAHMYIGVCVTAVLMFVTVVRGAQVNTLPAPLIATYHEREDRESLVVVDPTTLEISSFYSESGASANFARAVAWSPSGEYLAAYFSPDISLTSLVEHICILDRTGHLLQCMVEPPMAATSPIQDLGQLTTLSWASDSQSIFYASQTEHSIRLVQGSISTGQTIRLIYEREHNEDGLPASLSWSPDTEQVAVNLGSREATVFQEPQLLIDLKTGDVINLGQIMRDSQDNIGRLRLFCLRFSPMGNYITAITEKSRKSLHILNRQGEIVHSIISENANDEMELDCPIWQTDESGLYFAGLSWQDDAARLFHYSMTDATLSVAYRLPGGPAEWADAIHWLVNPMDISPDGTAIVGAQPYQPNHYLGLSIGVLFLGGDLINLSAHPNSLSSAIWMPSITIPTATPEPSETPTPTPQPLIYRAIQKGHQVHIERTLSAGIDTFDSPPRGDGWTLVGRTHGSGTDGTLMAFVVLDDVPYAAVQNARKGCIVVTPESLEPVEHAGTRKVEIVEEGVAARCAGDWSGFAP